MPQDTQSVALGTELDGTAGQGFFDFEAVLPDDKELTRAVILNASISSVGTFSASRLVLAPSLAAATVGPYLELGLAASGSGLTLACCRCVVPYGYNLFAFTTEDTAAAKSFFVDWYPMTVIPKVGG
jgi:hypothetical protein